MRCRPYRRHDTGWRGCGRHDRRHRAHRELAGGKEKPAIRRERDLEGRGDLLRIGDTLGRRTAGLSQHRHPGDPRLFLLRRPRPQDRDPLDRGRDRPGRHGGASRRQGQGCQRMVPGIPACPPWFPGKAPRDRARPERSPCRVRP